MEIVMSRTLIVVLILLSLNFSCERASIRSGFKPMLLDQVVVLKAAEANVRQHENRITQITDSRISSKAKTDDPFRHVQFLNEKIGWSSTHKSLYRTSNGGKNWEALAFHPPEEGRISSLFFIDEFQGWLTVVKTIDKEGHGFGNSSQILVSSDGGYTWKEQVSLTDGVAIKSVSFADGNHGLATGARVINKPANLGAPYNELLVLSTQNGGAVWQDVTDRVNSASEPTGSSLGDSGMDIDWSTPSEAFLLTKSGRVLHTQDQGKIWRSVVTIRAHPQGMASSAIYNKLVFDPEKRIRLIGGVIGDEGYWGELVIDRDDSWTAHRLLLRPILDAVFLSEYEALSCGVEIRPSDDDRKPPAQGIVLWSGDGGGSWTPIYQSNATETFISISKVGAQKFYAISDAGRFVSFYLNK
jgi:photosystem II stability/assembly factor-like uncharacterized protein